MPVDHRLFGKPVVESTSKFAGIEGEAGLAIGTGQAVDLGGLAVHLDGTAVDRQDARRCSAADEIGGRQGQAWRRRRCRTEGFCGSYRMLSLGALQEAHG